VFQALVIDKTFLKIHFVTEVSLILSMMKKLFLLCLILLLSFTKTICQNNYLDSLRQRLGTEEEDTARVNTIFNLALLYSISSPDSAVMYGTQGLQLAQKISYKSGEASCMGALCLSLTFLGSFPKALDFGFKAMEIYKELKDTSQLIWTNLQLMGCYNQQEDYEEALTYGHNAIKLFGWSRPDTNQMSIVLGLMGTVYGKINQLDSALYYAQKSYALNRGGIGSNISQVLGETYAKMGQNDLALSYYRKGIAVAVKDLNSMSLVTLYNDISKVLESDGNIDSSIYYANRSMIQARDNPEGLLQAYTQLAHLYASQKVNDSAIKYLQLTIALKDSLFNRKKTKEAQSLIFNEKLHQQELSNQQQQDESKMRFNALLAVVIICLLIAFFLFRNNRQKQKANILLTQQKQKVEATLSELKSTQAQLIQSEKMASLGELTAGIAHEIQNPLNFVNNFSDVNTELVDELQIELKSGNTEEAISISTDIKENQQKINYHGKRADSIVKGMLQHSKTSTGQKELTDINKLADEYLRLSYHGMRARDKSFNSDMQTDFDETIGKTNVVPQDIGRVLLNLYNNAFYAVNEKKKTDDENYQPVVSVQTRKLNDKIEIKVTDNGNGIPQNIVDKIFQPFFTTKPTGQGTGLGLSLAYDIVTKEHGGAVRVQSEEGKGSKFIIQLPTAN
jgi:signal transduction histidine kinase